jgi:hypothetical protein
MKAASAIVLAATLANHATASHSAADTKWDYDAYKPLLFDSKVQQNVKASIQQIGVYRTCYEYNVLDIDFDDFAWVVAKTIMKRLGFQQCNEIYNKHVATMMFTKTPNTHRQLFDLIIECITICAPPSNQLKWVQALLDELMQEADKAKNDC